MAMTISEMIRFLDEQAQENCQWVVSHAQAGNLPMVEVNAQSYVEAALTSALIQWRTGVGSPTAAFGRLVTDVTGFLPNLYRLSPEPAHIGFRFEVINYVNILLGIPIDARVLHDCLPGNMPDDQVLNKHSLGERLPDIALILRLQTGEQWPVWTSFIKRRSAKRQLRLWCETYHAYWELIDKGEARDLNGVADIALNISQLFDRRGRDPYYANGFPYEGGGLDNDKVVDFRLAAILHVYAQRGVEPVLPQDFAHKWRIA